MVCDTGLYRVPPSMRALEHLTLGGNQGLVSDWLPESSRQSVRVLNAHHTPFNSVPAGMRALEAVRMSSCSKTLPVDWLPGSSRRRVRLLFVDHSRLSRIPEGIARLETVSVEGWADGRVASGQ